MPGIFEEQFADHRVIHVPVDVEAQQRDAFVTKITAAARKQAGLAAKSGAVLRLDGSVREEGDCLIIGHEPARPLRPTILGETDDLPAIADLLWISATIVDALKAGGPGLIHGSILAESLYLDETGRIKLGDFGIVPAFEDAFGLDVRREMHCEGGIQSPRVGNGHCSGEWRLLSDTESREHGWMAPYLGHDLLGGTLRLNSKGDQFAAGVVLYALATGHHPFGAEFSDPSLMLYFHLEPYPLNEERSEWEQAFERAEKDLATDADKAVLAWSGFLRRLLASEPAERFANAAEAGKQIEPFCSPEWRAASEALSKGMALLDEGEVESLLDLVSPWRGAAALPALWHSQLDGWITDIEARKEEIAAYKRLRLRLADAQEALQSVEVEQAREIAREIIAAPQCDDELRDAAEELIALGDEQAEFIASGADDLAVAYLDSAKASLAAYAFEPAQQVLRGLLSDPAIPKTRLTQARELLAEVELAEQRLEQQERELAEATDDRKAWRLDAARQRLDALAEAGEMPDALAEQVSVELFEARSAADRRMAQLTKLTEAHVAWESADAESLTACLAEVPEDAADPQVQGARAKCAAQLSSLEAALLYQKDAHAKLEEENFEAALKAAQAGTALEGLPEPLRDDLGTLADTCRQKIETSDRHAREIEATTVDLEAWRLEAACEKCDALAAAEDLTHTQRDAIEPVCDRAWTALRKRQAGQEALVNAEKSWKAADLSAMQVALARVPAETDDPELSTRRMDLVQRAAALTEALAGRDRCRELCEAESFEEALSVAQMAAAVEKLPELTRTELLGLVEKCQSSIGQRDRRRTEFNAALKELQAWHLDQAIALFDALAQADDLTRDIEEKAKAAREKAVSARNKRQTRIETMQQAEPQWQAGDLDGVQARLAEVPETTKDPVVLERRARLAERAKTLASALQVQSECAAHLQKKAFDQALACAERAAALKDIPSSVAAALAGLLSQCRESIAQHDRQRREQAEALLERCATDLEELKTAYAAETLTPRFVDDPQLPESLRKRACDLRDLADRLVSVLARFEHAREHLKEGGFKDAAALLQGVKTDDLPPAAAAAVDRLHAQVAEQQARHAEQQRQMLARQLDCVAQHLGQGQIDEARTMLAAVADAEFLDDALRGRCKDYARTLKQQQPILAAITTAEQALARDNVEPSVVEQTLSALPSALPDWAKPRVTAAREKAGKIAEHRKRDAITKARAALDAAAKTLEGGDCAAARAQLDQVTAAIKLDEQLAQRHEKLSREAGLLETWLPRVAALEQALKTGRLAPCPERSAGAGGRRRCPRAVSESYAGTGQTGRPADRRSAAAD